MNKNMLIVTTVSGFLSQFEKYNVQVIQSFGYTVHYASNMNYSHYLYDAEELDRMGILKHHIDIERSPYELRTNIRAFSQLKKIIEENQISLIHCHTPVGGVLSRLARQYFKKVDVKLIYTVHGFHFYHGAPFINNTLYYMVERILARCMDVVIVINEEDYVSAKKFQKKVGYKVYKIPGVGLDLEKFHPCSEAEVIEARAELGIKEDDFFMVSVGELNENKNQHLVLRALVELRRRNKDISKIKYGICGHGFYTDKMKEWIRSYDLEEQVIMLGYRQDVEKVLGAADASVFPSIREGLGMAGLEALAMGVFTIASDNRGTREYMRHLENGYVFQSGSVEGLMAGIEYAVCLDRTQKEKITACGIETAQRFDKKYAQECMRTVYSALEEESEKR